MAQTRSLGSSILESADPTQNEFYARAEFDAGDYNERSYGAVLSGPLRCTRFGVSIQRCSATAATVFIYNAYLASP